MKKIWIGIILLFVLICTKKVYAFDLGVSTNEDYEGITSSDEYQTIGIRGGARNAIAVTYGMYWDDNESIRSININVTVPSEVSILSSSDDTNTISGSNGNYTVTIDPEHQYGTAVINIQMPTPARTTEYQVNATATSYDENSTPLSSKSITIKYIVLVKNTSCDNNSSIEISTTGGNAQNIGAIIAEQFALSTTADKLDITINPQSSKTKIFYGPNGSISDNMQFLPSNKLDNVSLNYGENEFAFLIETECFQEWDAIAQQVSGNFTIGVDIQDMMYYPSYAALIITRLDNRSKTNTLNSLSITDVKINFNPDLKTYIATVPYEVSSVKITSTLKDSKSSYVEGFGNRTVALNEGLNDVLIKVRAENGSESVYTIKITRSPNEDASLKKLLINGKEIILKKDTLIYSTYVDNNIKNITIKAEPTDEKAKVEISNIGELKEGSNLINITVTASSGKKNIYAINVIRDKLISENSHLKSIKIKNHDISFNPETLEYTITKNKNEDKLDITVETENDKATYIIIGNKKIKNKTIIKIKVTAQDKKTTTNYIIHIKEEQNNTVFLVGIIGGIIFCVIGITILLIKKKKEKKIAIAPPLQIEPVKEEQNVETSQMETPKVEEQNVETPKVEEQKTEE